MLSDDEKREIEMEATHYPRRAAVASDALKIVQRHRGWVSDEAVADLAAFLGMSPAELDSIATFYTLIFRKSVGRHVILICDSVSCWVMGYDPLRQHLEERLGITLGQTTPDGLFTLLPVACLGACDHAPTMMIDGELFGDLDAEKVDELIEQYRRKSVGSEQ